MIIKRLEIRDRGTLIPALAIQVSSADGPILERAGYGSYPMVLLINLARLAVQHDPYDWGTDGTRTMPVAHLYIQKHFDAFTDGQVVCVEYLLGERDTPKVSELQPEGSR